MRSLIALSTLAILAVGCGGPKSSATTGATGGAAATGLKELKKEDLIVGKPTEFNPKMEPLALGDRPFVRYKGQFVTGQEFDSNLGVEKSAYGFTIGNKEVIEGWERGVIGMLPGGKRRLSVPWKMAYGEAGSETIPPKSDLYFEVEVIDVVKAGEAAIYRIKDRTTGTGAEAKEGSTVTVEFELRIPGSDQIFDSSKIQGKNQTFKIGSKQALPAIEDAVIGMKVGGVRDVWLPPALGPLSGRLAGFPEETITITKLKLLSVK